jgi:dCMP deaminase
MADWNKRYVDAAKFYASWSKDESNKVGAVIYNPKTKTILSSGFNGFPRGVNDNVEERKVRPLKYLFTIHAERNSIYNAARHGITLDGMGMALDWFPCSGCAGAIVQVGITEIICSAPDFNHERWGADFKIASEILNEAGVNIITQEQEKRP